MSFIVKGLRFPDNCCHCVFDFEENGIHKCRAVYHGVTEEIHQYPFFHSRLQDCPLEEIEDAPYKAESENKE